MNDTKQLMKSLAYSIANQVEQAMRVDIHKLEQNILTSDDPEQRKYERFFRDLFEIPTPKKALLQLADTYIEDLFPEHIRGIFKSEEEANQVTAETVRSAFKYNFRAGLYSLGHIPIQEASKDVNEVLSKIKQNYAEVVRMYYGFNPESKTHTISEIANKNNTTKQNISLLKKHALEAIKKNKLIEDLATKYSSIAQQKVLSIQRIDSLANRLEQEIKKFDERQAIRGELEQKEPGAQQYFNESVDVLEKYLSNSEFKAIKDYRTIGNLALATGKELQKKRNIGLKKAAKINRVLREHFGLSLKGNNNLQK